MLEDTKWLLLVNIPLIMSYIFDQSEIFLYMIVFVTSIPTGIWILFKISDIEDKQNQPNVSESKN